MKVTHAECDYVAVGFVHLAYGKTKFVRHTAIIIGCICFNVLYRFLCCMNYALQPYDFNVLFVSMRCDTSAYAIREKVVEPKRYSFYIFFLLLFRVNKFVDLSLLPFMDFGITGQADRICVLSLFLFS